MSFVASSYWPQYAADRARDIYGDATGTPYWNAERFADDLRLNIDHPFILFDLDGTEYWSDGQP